jgi:hypothetical protein
LRGFATPFFDGFLKQDADAMALLGRLDGLAPEVRIESEGAPSEPRATADAALRR